MRRALTVLIVAAMGVFGLASVSEPPIALAAETVALDTLTLGTTTGSPTLGCGATTCAAVQAGGPTATLVPSDGTITRLRVRHGAIDGGGILATEGALHVLSRAGTSYTVKASAALTFTATEAADSLSTFEVDLAVAAGDYLGLEIRGAYAQSRPLFLAEGTQADTAAVYAGAHAAGTQEYAERAGQVALFAVDLVTGASDPTDPTDPTDPVDPGRTCPTPAERSTRTDPAASTARTGDAEAARAGGWRRSELGRQDRMMDLQLAYDDRGRPHVAARGATRYAVHYYGPRGHRVLDRTVDQNDGVGMTMGSDGRPIVVWGERKPTTEDGRVVYCPRLHIAVPGKSDDVVRALPERTRSAFLHPEIVRAGKRLHLAYDVNGRLVHHRSGQTPQQLPVKTVRRIRIDASGNRLLLGATNARGRMTVFQKVGGQPFRVLVRGKHVHDFDVAYAGRKPVVAWSGGKVRRLTVVTAGQRVRTRTPAEAVALATRGGLTHVVFSTVAQTSCGAFGCLHGGVYHVGLKGRRIVQQPSLVARGATSPFRLAVATHGKKVGVAMSRNGVTALYQR